MNAVSELLSILRDYPTGQDDGTWIRRRAEALLRYDHGADLADFINSPGYVERPGDDELVAKCIEDVCGTTIDNAMHDIAARNK